MDYRFYMAVAAEDTDEKFVTGDFYDLEKRWPCLHYKQFKNLNAYGAPKVFSESFAEDDRVQVVFGESAQCEQTDVTLTLLFFDDTPGADVSVARANADRDYHEFVNFISGHLVAYYDTARERKAVLCFLSAATPAEDRLHGVAYKQVDFKFKNLFGRTFPKDSGIFTTPTEGLNISARLSVPTRDSRRLHGLTRRICSEKITPQ